ncbi:unnamed protein product [Amoebophrya sp. A25]|nr:unnamed protein product [Amoebophrya sp. A25]|eukprot:GSA25T00015208001.1
MQLKKDPIMLGGGVRSPSSQDETRRDPCEKDGRDKQRSEEEARSTPRKIAVKVVLPGLKEVTEAESPDYTSAESDRRCRTQDDITEEDVMFSDTDHAVTTASTSSSWRTTPRTSSTSISSDSSSGASSMSISADIDDAQEHERQMNVEDNGNTDIICKETPGAGVSIPQEMCMEIAGFAGPFADILAEVSKDMRKATRPLRRWRTCIDCSTAYRECDQQEGMGRRARTGCPYHTGKPVQWTWEGEKMPGFQWDCCPHSFVFDPDGFGMEDESPADGTS